MRVVGIVADAQEQRVSFGAPHAAWYLPYRQHDYLRDLYLVVRGDPSPARVRELIRRLDPHQPLAGPRALTEHVEEVTGSDRVAALVMAYFASLGLALVAVGIHGSMQRFVGQQHRAIGTRMALGAGPRRVVAGVVGRGLALAVLGSALGAWGAVAIHPLVAGFVYDALLDPPTRLAATVAAVLGLAAAACITPAYRAGRIDPARLLRD
jgi:predicted lysophospholipase L1 biosynthesis ABC-type transport system permease subunit